MANGSTAGSLMVNVYDGTRQPISAGIQILVRIRDGNQKEVVSDYFRGPHIKFENLPVYNNFGDNYAVWLSAGGYADAGLHPVKMAAGAVQSVDVMLVPKEGSFNFRDALWPALKQTHPNFAAILAQGAPGDAAAESRYTQFLETQAASLASFLNLATAMSAIHLPVGTPLDYFHGVIWDDPKSAFAQDRFFGWADPKIIDQIITATAQGEFVPEIDPGSFHGTATRSWKQIQFGEANVQLTFHENDDRQTIGGVECVKIEPDIDYYKDLLAHALLEVAVNSVTHSLTDPKQVYVLRWMAGRRAGVPDFNPPYVIE